MKRIFHAGSPSELVEVMEWKIFLRDRSSGLEEDQVRDASL